VRVGHVQTAVPHWHHASNRSASGADNP
jgi:hypothetical protein